MHLPDLPRFYHPGVGDGVIVLSDEEAAHARVLRLKDGDSVHVVNGEGKLWESKVASMKKRIELHLLSLVQEAENKNALHLAIAPTKNMTRLEWVIEKATELGVKRITPISCEHSERVHLKNDRLDKIAISAIKQSKGLWKPIIDPLTPFKALIEHSNESHKWIAHCKDDLDRAPLTSVTLFSDQLICIGPEGDFSESEITVAQKLGFTGLSLGDRRLRTETAAITACIAANLFGQRP
ncbi:MAG: RsmE family RNA methyltransferase [Flavobacteriales bacterium]